jgi:hypothetical protein
MRKYVILAVVALASMAMASFAQADDIQSVDATIKPTKLDKKKYVPAELFVDVQTKNNTGAASNSDQPPSATRTIVDFTKNLKFDTSAVPNCEGSEADLQNTTTDAAKEVCGSKSIVSVASGTSAHVTVDSNPAAPGSPPVPIDVVVTAFNGTNPNTIYLHARADAANNTSVLVGKLGKGRSSEFGSNLDVTIPPLLAGAIDDFKTTVKNGKYVQARCKSTTNQFAAETTFTNFTPSPVTDTSSTTCKQKKSKKGGK